jgi:tripartite-type tricarboxylate transporter receptor subunit TctC
VRRGGSKKTLLSRRDHALFGLHRIVLCAVAVLLVTLSCQLGWSQTPIKIVMPAPAGGAGDVVARMLTEQVSQAQGRAMVIENRAGAGTIIGTEAVARAAPDGNTLLITAPYLVIAPHLRKLNFDPLTSFEPICHLVSSPGVIVVNSASPYGTLADFVEAARAKPGELTFAAVGPGTVQHVGFEMLKRAANVNLTFVPYTGGAPAITALLGAHVTAVFAEYAPLAEHLKSGKLRAIATTTRTRIGSLPEVPTVAETYKDYEVDFWWGLFAPAKTPPEKVLQFAEWFKAAMQAPEIKPKLAAQSFLPVGTCGADFGALLRKEYDHYGGIIRATNMKAE